MKERKREKERKNERKKERKKEGKKEQAAPMVRTGRRADNRGPRTPRPIAHVVAAADSELESQAGRQAGGAVAAATALKHVVDAAVCGRAVAAATALQLVRCSGGERRRWRRPRHVDDMASPAVLALSPTDAHAHPQRPAVNACR